MSKCFSSPFPFYYVHCPRVTITGRKKGRFISGLCFLASMGKTLAINIQGYRRFQWVCVLRDRPPLSYLFFSKVHVHCVRRAGDLCLSHPFYSGFIFPSFPLPLLGHDRIALKATEEQRWFQNVRKKRRPERRGKRKKEENVHGGGDPLRFVGPGL